MNERIVIEEMIRQQPRERVLKRLLIDWLQEYEGYTWTMAARVTCAIAREVIHTREMAEAASYMNADSVFRLPLVYSIRDRLPDLPGEPMDVYLVNGSRPPTCTRRAIPRSRHECTPACITVGSRWVLRAVDELLQIADALPPSMRPAFSN